MVEFFSSFLIGIVLVVVLLATLMVVIIIGSSIRDAKKRRAMSDAEFKETLEFMSLQFKSFLDSGGEIVRADGGSGQWENYVLRHGLLEIRINNHFHDWEVTCQPAPLDGEQGNNRKKEVSIPLGTLARYFNNETPRQAAERATKEVQKEMRFRPLRGKIAESARLLEEVVEPAQEFFHPDNLARSKVDFDAWRDEVWEAVKPIYMGDVKSGKP